ncbi:hypothetical protein B0H03_11325 [Rathayibacter iranicus NCPPB 2253 = VKM Ac-1602]|uniref:Uncharacterized protein n=2 Tax=Rathayibacter iranicus TaxID=59737 RepID=A0ABX5LD42_9MICO|nr:hypothetical protein B0H03_11325 [Rathayibacter iranicus NCPPB 2253 = VKM Ac-1602]
MNPATLRENATINAMPNARGTGWLASRRSNTCPHTSMAETAPDTHTTDALPAIQVHAHRWVPRLLNTAAMTAVAMKVAAANTSKVYEDDSC